MQSKKLVWVLLTIGALIVAVIVFVMLKPKTDLYKNQPVGTGTSQQMKPVTTDPSQLPDRFPPDVPLEAGAEVTQNYTTSKAGYFQSTRAFATKKSAAENMRIYETYFKDSGWTVIQKIEEKGVRSLTATQDTTRAHVDIIDNQATGARTVEITIEYLSS